MFKLDFLRNEALDETFLLYTFKFISSSRISPYSVIPPIKGYLGYVRLFSFVIFTNKSSLEAFVYLSDILTHYA